MCSYADDTTFHTCEFDLQSHITRLLHDVALVIEWFESSYMKLDHDKCHFLYLEHKYEILFAT